MGSSKSSSQANQATYNTVSDDRIVNESGLVTRDSVLDFSSHVTDLSTKNLSNTTNTNTTTNTSTTSGSYNVTADPVIAKAAFDFATNADATLGAGMEKMLGWASELTGKSQDNATALAGRFTDSVAQAFDSARNTTPGGIDNKTMIILGVAGAAAIAFANRKGN